MSREAGELKGREEELGLYKALKECCLVDGVSASASGRWSRALRASAPNRLINRRVGMQHDDKPNVHPSRFAGRLMVMDGG